MFDVGARTTGSAVRLIRSFRVIRLMSHVKSLRGIIEALFDSIIPVSNAFTILLLIISVCKCQSEFFSCTPNCTAEEYVRLSELKSLQTQLLG